MKKIILKIGIAVMRGFFAVLKLFPQNKNSVLFLSRQADKPSVDFEMLAKQLKEDKSDFKIKMRCYRFVASEAGLKDIIKFALHFMGDVISVSRARVVILDTYSPAVSLFKQRKTLLVVQIWHAIGSMKKFGYAMIGKPEGSSSETARLMRMHRGYDYMMISSKSFLKDYLEGFDTTEDKVIEIPLPKADLLTDEKNAEEKRKSFFAEHPECAEKKNILYCPTFRKENDRSTWAVNEIYGAMDKEKFNLIVKLHPLSNVSELPEGVITSNLPTYEVVFAADYVISDYSSVIYEAGLAGKPLFAFAYDWEEYSSVREINFDISREFPGLFTADIKEIMTAIENDDYDKARQKSFIDKNVVIPEEGAAKALSSFIINHLK